MARVLVLSFEFPPLGGGGSVVIEHLCNELSKKGHSFDVVTMGYKGLPKEEQVGACKVYRVSCLRAKKELSTPIELQSYLFSAFVKAEQLLLTNHYDLAHVHFIIPTGNLGFATKIINHLPFIISTHGSDMPGYNPDRFGFLHKLLIPFWTLFVKSASVVTTPSESLRSLLLQSWKGDSSKIKAIPWGIDVRPAPRKKENRIVFAGRLFERKGAQYLVEAVKGMNMKGWEVAIVGDGPMRKQLEAQAKCMPFVKFYGWLPREKLQSLYDRSKIFIFPSTAESFGMVLAEAMSAEMAVITCNDSACPEVVGDAGILVQPKNHEAIRTALQKLMASPTEVARLGKKGRKRVLAKFTWPICAAAFDKIYAQTARK